MAEIWNVTYKEFILTGFSGSKEWRQLLLILFTVLFSISVPANIILLLTIITKKSLHEPMYILIGVLCAVDLSSPVIFIPKLLYSLLNNFYHIPLLACLVQIFFVHFTGFFQSTILLWMAIDRYYAICRPLHYNECMSFKAFLKFVIFPLMRNFGFLLAMVIMAAPRAYCQNQIRHCFVEHMGLVGLACGSTQINSIVGLSSTFFVRIADFFLIILSYSRIFFSVFRSGNISRKALSTCFTHIFVMILGLTLALSAILAYRIKNDMPNTDRIILSTLYLFCPSCFHPIIYGYMIKEIRQNIIKSLKFGKVDPNLFSKKQADVK